MHCAHDGHDEIMQMLTPFCAFGFITVLITPVQLFNIFLIKYYIIV